MKRLFNWFRRRKLESDLDRELKYHRKSATSLLGKQREDNQLP
jgi:hypothetical protein